MDSTKREAKPVSSNILEVIRELLNASGPQSFSQILRAVRNQCQGAGNLEEAHRQVKAHLAYLMSLQSVIEQNDGFGIVYNHPND